MIMKLPRPKLKKITLARRIMNYLTEERSSSEMKDSEQPKFSSLQERPALNNWTVFTNTATPPSRNAMLTSEKICSRISYCPEVVPCSMVWERECGKKFIN